jgi:hypothetical protein
MADEMEIIPQGSRIVSITSRMSANSAPRVAALELALSTYNRTTAIGDEDTEAMVKRAERFYAFLIDTKNG